MPPVSSRSVFNARVAALVGGVLETKKHALILGLVFVCAGCGPQPDPSQTRPTAEEIADAVDVICDQVQRCPESGVPIEEQVEQCIDVWTDIFNNTEGDACLRASLEYRTCQGELSCKEYGQLAGRDPFTAPYCSEEARRSNEACQRAR